MSGIFRYNNTSNSTPNRRSTLSPFCTSPGQLQDVTMDNSYSMGYRSPCVSMPYGGNTSPGQGRSVREFEEQMGNLRKENFNLKLRIYFLEEKIPGYGSSTSDGPESFLKQNVDLKVDIEVLRKELQDKQSLLCEAAKAMELMEEQQKATEEKSQEIIDELNQKILYLEMEDKQLEKSSSEHHTLEQLMGRTDLAGDIDVLQKVRELEGFVKQYEQKTEELTNQINKLENTIEQKNNSILEMNEILKQIKFQNAELQEQLDEKTQQTANIEKNLEEFNNKIINEKSDEITLLNSRNKILTTNIEKFRIDFDSASFNLKERNRLIKEQQRLMEELQLSILNKKKHAATLEKSMEDYEKMSNELKIEKQKLLKENFNLKDIIVKLEHTKLIERNQPRSMEIYLANSSIEHKNNYDKKIISENDLFKFNQSKTSSNSISSYLPNPLFSKSSILSSSMDPKNIGDTIITNARTELKLKDNFSLYFDKKKLIPTFYPSPNFYINETRSFHKATAFTNHIILSRKHPNDKTAAHKKTNYLLQRNFSLKFDNNPIEKLKDSFMLTCKSNSFDDVSESCNDKYFDENLHSSSSDTSLASSSNYPMNNNNNNNNNENIIKINNNLISNESDYFLKCPKLREELHEHKKQLADKICSLEEYETKLKDKTLAHEQACNAIRKLILNTKDLEAEIDKLKKSKSLQNVSQIKEGTTTLNSDSVASSISSSYKDDLEISTMKVKFEKIIDKKDIEIEKLKLEVKKKTANLQNLVNKELWEKNREIERLTKLLGKKNASSLMPSSPVHDIGQLQQSFSDSDYTQAVERNKHLQKRVDTLIYQLANVSDKNSDEVIQQLKIEIHDAREEADKAHRWRKECADVCAVLTSRLEELAGFLDTLLKHKDVLGALAADRRRAMRKAIDKSLDLSRSLNNMSLSVSRISMSEHSFGYMNNISELMNESIENKENKTFNSHENDNGQIKLIENLKTEIKTLKKELDKRKVIDLTKKERRSLPLPLTFDNHSESETWSEPDRNVSLARIGLDESINNKPIKNIENENRNTSTESDSDLNQKTRSKSQDKTSQLELLVSQRDNHILKVQCDLVEADNRLKMESLRIVDLKRELDEYKKVNEMLEIEIANYKAQTNQFEKVLNEQDINKKQLDESKQLIAQLTDDRGALNVEVRVAEMKIENLKTDLEEMKCKHELKLNTIIEDGKQKLHDLQKELTEKFETKLKDQEYKQKEYLAKDWISRIFYEETKRELDDVQKRLNEAQFTIEFMRENEIEFNTKLVDNEKSMRNLKKTLDEATLQASRAVLERTKILNDKLHLENKNQELLTQLTSIEHERNELNSRLSELENSYALLNNKLVNNTNAQYKHNNNCINSKTQSNGSDISQSGYTSEDVPMGVQRGAGRQRFDNSSPDLGIESDAGRASSVEIASADSQHLRTIELSNSTKNILEEVNSDITKLTDGTQNNMINSNNTNPNNTGLIIAHDCVKVDQENSDLRKKLVRTKRALEDTWNKLRTANQRKEQIERDIRQQILKTQTVLKNVRTNMETELEQHKKE